MEKKSFFQKYWLVMLCGLLIGAAAVLLSAFGNPANMGFCIACFLRDIAGSLKLHQAGVVQYFRPEIVGIIVGACLMALIGKEFKPKAGSSPVIRFTLGAAVMVGALVFLGCPLRMVIRLGSGDLNALVGLVGFIAGILAGNYDIVEVYLDGVLKLGNHDLDGLGKLLDELNVLAGDGVKVVVTVSADMDVLPESVKKYA